MNKKVYIIILNWNGISDTLDCLESLEKIDYPNYETVLVDNGSENNEGQRIKKKHPRIHLIQNEKNQGYGQGNNIGIEYALDRGAEYILLLNNDTVVSPGFLTPLVRYAEQNEEVGVVGPKILYHGSDRIWFNGGMIWWWAGASRHLERLKKDSRSRIRTPLEVDYITGCCCLAKREVFEEIGLLDPAFFTYYDDTDWCIRAGKAGYKNVVVPDSVIWHKVSSALGRKGTKKIGEFAAYYYARNPFIFAKNNLCGVKKMVFLFSHITLQSGLNLVLCVNNRARLRYVKGLLQGLTLDLKNDED